MSKGTKYHDDKVREFLNFILERYKKEIGSNKLSWIDKDELKRAFNGAVNIREGYFGLQREIYR